MPFKNRNISVIGAGISGLICARRLKDAGFDVTVFEKSRGVGGRMATRRATDGFAFDHGAQYFTVRDSRFERWCREWQDHGAVAPWEGRVVTLTEGKVELKQNETLRYAGVPGMNAVCKQLATEIDIQFQTRVAPPTMQNGAWRLRDEDGRELGNFHYVIVSAPAPQTADLLAAAPELQHAARNVEMSGCWAVMLGFDSPLDLPFDGAFVHESSLSWVARNSSKPNRDRSNESWVLHGSPTWTDQHIDDDSESVLPELVDAFWQVTGCEPRAASYLMAHRWRYSIPTEPLESRCLFDPNSRIGACGDWCGGPRVEGAFLSGMALADEVLRQAVKPGS